MAGGDSGGSQSAPRAIPISAAEPEGYAQGATLTFILVGSEEQADHLRSLRAESSAFVDPSMAIHEVVILSVGTAEEELRAMATIGAANEAVEMGPFPPAVSVVDARETDFGPR